MLYKIIQYCTLIQSETRTLAQYARHNTP